MFGIPLREVFALMVFCKACKKKVEDCVHFVYPIEGPRVSVYDPKIETLAYSREHRILEITFKTGQVWQLFEVPDTIYEELRDTTISSFLKFIAHKYRSAPVKTGLNAIRLPGTENCLSCNEKMTIRHRINSRFDANIRVLWECQQCNKTMWKDYGSGLMREKKGRWH
jgi:uncharacterized protein with PIN domain